MRRGPAHVGEDDTHAVDEGSNGGAPAEVVYRNDELVRSDRAPGTLRYTRFVGPSAAVAVAAAAPSFGNSPFFRSPSSPRGDLASSPPVTAGCAVMDAAVMSPFWHSLRPPPDDPLLFESRFESGNLQEAVRIAPREYNLLLRRYADCVWCDGGMCGSCDGCAITVDEGQWYC